MASALNNNGLTRLQGIMAVNRGGGLRGVYSVCSAHPVVLEAALRQSARDDSVVLIEATANQVNQQGGYTGLGPVEFREMVERMARRVGVSNDRIVLGGDHLGPICWTAAPSKHAMAMAHELVAAYVQAGFLKIHLDTSMACADDREPLHEKYVASRAAELCRTAERAAVNMHGRSQIVYVIGTEVPAAGGTHADNATRTVTDAASAARTLEVHREVFRRNRLNEAWERVIAFVVEPGVGFDNESVVGYDPQAAATLKSTILAFPGLVYEAHSTDYQAPEALAGMVRDHFAILKVGPALTYALRQALFALSYIEAELIPVGQRANLPAVCEKAMKADPTHWRTYCAGEGLRARAARRFGYSDRIRYYWTQPRVDAAVGRLARNLASTQIPLPLLEQHLPAQLEEVLRGTLAPVPDQLVLSHVMRVTDRYARACNGTFSESGQGRLQ